jgi:hypothetical protein
MYHHINLLILLGCYAVFIYGCIVQDTNKRISCMIVGFVSIFIYPIIMELLINIYAKICSFCRSASKDKELHLQKHEKIFKKSLPICYSMDYNITACGLEKCHPFDSCKYRRSKLKLNLFNLYIFL